ncbi:MAG: hypothetical protein CMH26_00265 [Micavibrio sp.]|nr:hypothetical protein [Micavibrio sp.]|tara:strand:+ start:918 stop:1604 length:687 start_codon:yes stop_codon:yes gene_type:complete
MSSALSALNSTTLISTSASSGSSNATSSAEELEQDKIEFLNLLLTQLENQNPLDPMDATEYTSQLVDYSQLEQQMEINTELSDLSDLVAENSATAGLSYIGQTVELDSDTTSVQDDSATWAYTVDGIASEVNITIQDENGDVIYEGEGTNNSTGANIFTLDMTDSGYANGSLLTMYVAASDSSGKTLDTTVSSYATVDGVQTQDGTAYFTAGGVSFLQNAILKIASSE